MTGGKELADNMILMRVFIRLHIELIGWYSCPQEYSICKPIILPREPSIANKLHGFKKSGFFNSEKCTGTSLGAEKGLD